MTRLGVTHTRWLQELAGNPKLGIKRVPLRLGTNDPLTQASSGLSSSDGSLRKVTYIC